MPEEPSETELLFEAEHVRVSVDPVRRVIWFARTATRPEDPEELLRDYRQAMASTGPAHRDHAAIVDARLAVGRQDAAFERVAATARREFVRRYARVVVLLQSVAGTLHARRFQSRDGLPITIVRTVEDALAAAAGHHVPSAYPPRPKD